jgi:hypothetical protein
MFLSQLLKTVLCHSANVLFWQLATVPTSIFFNVYFCQLEVFISLQFCQNAVLSNLLFHQLAVLSTRCFVNLQFCKNLLFHQLAYCQLDLLSTCSFVNLLYYQLSVLSTSSLVNLQFRLPLFNVFNEQKETKIWRLAYLAKWVRELLSCKLEEIMSSYSSWRTDKLANSKLTKQQIGKWQINT